MNDFINKLKSLVTRMNKLGVPVPTARDPQTGLGSVSFTLVLISSMIYMLGMFGKWSGKFGGIDMANAKDFFDSSCYLYFGRTLVKIAETVVTNMSAKPADPKPKADDPDSK